jgi:hypothetical protein
MKSKWFHLKDRAILLRKKGYSIRTIELRLGIPRSTLSGWLKDVPLTSSQRRKLRTEWNKSLKKARAEAVKWHNKQKEDRIELARLQAIKTLERLPKNPAIRELALAFLYLGEGAKRDRSTTLGNSNPMILRFFISVLQSDFGIPEDKFACWLHLRADQNPDDMICYWAKELSLPKKNFRSCAIDERTKGLPTYPHYKGVCIISCGNIAVQRKLLYLSNMFCDQIIGGHTGS